LLKQIMKIHNKIHSHDHATIVYFLIYHYLSFSGSIENDTLCPSIWRSSWSWSYGRVIMFNTTFNNISLISRRSVLLVEETGVSGENHRPVASHWPPLSHNVVSTERDSNSQR
jgi:hypothetical protein